MQSLPPAAAAAVCACLAGSYGNVGTARVGRWTGMAGCLGRFPQLVVPGPTARENRRTLANHNRECQDWDEEVAGPAKQSVSEAGEVMMKR
jgi:hypothetical protein